MQFLMETILGPMVRRVGSIIAGFLAAQGADAELTNQVIIGLGAAVAIIVDLVMARRRRKIPVPVRVVEGEE